MSNEITVLGSLQVINGQLKEDPSVSKRFDMDGNHSFSRVFDIAASDVSLAVPNIGTHGWCMMINTSDTEHIEISTGTGGSFSSHIFSVLEPGEFYLSRKGQTQFYARTESEYGITGQLKMVVIEQ